jgi:hypothetical protein
MWERTSVDVHVKAIVAVEVLIGHPRTVCASHTCCVGVCGARVCVWFTQSNGASLLRVVTVMVMVIRSRRWACSQWSFA